MFLSEFNKPVSELKGIGKKREINLAKLGIYTISDLLTHYPRDYEDRTKQIPLSSISEGGFAVTIATVVSHNFFGFGKKKTLKIDIKDDTGVAQLICFGRNFLVDKLKEGEKFFFAGNFTATLGGLQSTRFDFEPFCEKPKDFNKMLPLYPLTSELTHNFFRTTINQALQLFIKTIDDELSPQFLKNQKIEPIKNAIKEIHQPTDNNTLKKAIESLKFRELYELQLKTSKMRLTREAKLIHPLPCKLSLQQELINSLPFSLTADQLTSIEEINNDLLSNHPMGRILQGDVGSGKTLVALATALLPIASGKQVAILVPTELLAQQHAKKISDLVEHLEIRVALLTGSLQQAKKELVLKSLSMGEIDLIIGTHALFSNSVNFKELSLVIIDEQHKFGVRQRESMRKKGEDTHLLLMSATPIPRTLSMTLYGDLDISEIKTRPKGRIDISTYLTVEGNEHKVYQRVLAELEKGHQAYFIYPKIENDIFNQNSSSEMKNVVESYQKLSKQWFSRYNTALIHSDIEEAEKEQIMHKFNSGEISILMATTVVEVGIDNPNATLIVIEDAHRFGLSTLHQLRGRVGRSDLPSFCYLIYGKQLTTAGKERLLTMKKENDGFEIAQKDLEIRGAGELLGVKQSGELRLKIANPLLDSKLLKQAREAARLSINI